MRIGYYPGCSLLGSSREFDESTRAVLKALDVELVEVPDWNCCGASSAHVLDHELSLALPARIMALAEAAGLDEILAPCAACSNRLLTARQELSNHPEKRAEIETAIGMPYAGRVRIVNVLEVLDRLKDRIAEKCVASFQHSVACYYGCLLVRPPRVVDFDRPEDPQSLDRVMASVGANPIDWPFKTECCGAAFSMTRTDIVAKLGAKILSGAVKRGAEALIVACPMCHSNLDLRRDAINAHLKANGGQPSDVPVLFVTQVIGLALGIDPKTLGLQRHLVSVQLPKAESATAGTTV
ncbi:MAG TPA: CoB--CoM heterodisulfide reductase iron-sulfur subunit B family protein [Holophaga sp.]|nr:CoB--CoM heterodisulfide reductase iron-sulfur subunit B family protein [Holophaga sp.]